MMNFADGCFQFKNLHGGKIPSIFFSCLIRRNFEHLFCRPFFSDRNCRDVSFLVLGAPGKSAKFSMDLVEQPGGTNMSPAKKVVGRRCFFLFCNGPLFEGHGSFSGV